MEDADYISEFEELLKIKEFSQNSKMKMPFDCTYERIAKALKDEYTENINEKIERWVNVLLILCILTAGDTTPLDDVFPLILSLDLLI
jgi:hypothetical protein